MKYKPTKAKLTNDLVECLAALASIQTLAGRASGIYDDDRNPARADLLKPLLKEIADVALAARVRATQ